MNLTDCIKTAFEYKEAGDYKKAIDFLYKALALDNNSAEIMAELAELYSNLAQYDRSVSFYEQIINQSSCDIKFKLEYALLLKKIKNYDKAKSVFVELFDSEYELDLVAKELFEILVLNSNYDELISLYNKKYNILHDSSILYYVALAYENLNKYTLAKDFFNKSYQLNNSNVEAGINIVNLLFNEEKYDDALSFAQNMLKVSENDKLLYFVAEIKFMKNDLDSAMQYYSYAIKANDSCAMYYVKLGIVFTVKGFTQEAEESFCRALILEPENLYYNYVLAYLYYTQNKKALAMSVIDTILEIDCNYISAVALKTLIYIEDGKITECGSFVHKLENNTEDNDFVYFVLSKYYEQFGMWQKSIDVIKKAVFLKPDSVEYKYQLALNYYNFNKYKKSNEICDQILFINNKYIEAYILKANVLFKLQEYSNAFDNAKNALKLDENSSGAYFILGKICFNRHDWEKAIENFKIAILISPKKIECYRYIADAYYKMQNYKDAYYYYKETVNFNVADVDSYYFMAKCAIEMENSESALSNFSIMNRLSPYNVPYMIEYAQYLASCNKCQMAQTVLKTLLKGIKDKSDIELVKNNLLKIKKSS